MRTIRVDARPRRRTKAIGCALAALALLVACGSRDDDARYAAERRLFEARKLREDVVSGGMKPEFLERAVEAYRSVVSEYADAAVSSRDIDVIVVSAQMELAELEFRAQLLLKSRSDFEKAIEIARNVAPARANALYSAAVISEELGEAKRAYELYERFAHEFLHSDSLENTARMNVRYLVTPLKLAGLAARAGESGEAARWYRAAEHMYTRIAADETDPAIVKETRFNLLTTYLQQKNWSAALALAGELMKEYPGPRDVSTVLFIEAKIRETGLGRPREAHAGYLAVAERFPREEEAATALVAAAAIDRRAGRAADARALYERVIDEYRDRVGDVVEAHWQLAEMDERAGRWEEASLRYKTIYANYPETLPGFEAPLRIAHAYEAKGEADAANAAYDRALEHYRELADGQRRSSTRIMAEQYYVRALTDRKLWRDAAERLLALPDRYPEYGPFRENYLAAASILERELKDPAGAARVLETCVARYPGTELARTAAEELTRLRGGRR